MKLAGRVAFEVFFSLAMFAVKPMPFNLFIELFMQSLRYIFCKI